MIKFYNSISCSNTFIKWFLIKEHNNSTFADHFADWSNYAGQKHGQKNRFRNLNSDKNRSHPFFET